MRFLAQKRNARANAQAHCAQTMHETVKSIRFRGGSTRWTWDPRGPRLREISKKSYAPRGKFVDINF